MTRSARLFICGALATLALAVGVTACKRQKGSTVTTPPEAVKKAVIYHCPMHPTYTSDKPGQCPICHMTLVPSDEAPAQVTQVQIDPSRQNALGVHVSSVTRRELFQNVRASARVAYDPALYSAILEHQQAVAALEAAGKNSGYRAEAESTVRASRLRLRQMGLSDGQISRMSVADANPSNLLLGQAGGTLWVYADLYDYEAAGVRQGQAVDLSSPAFPSRTFRGTVRAVDAVLNSETRTLRARIETPNPDGALKPEMYLTATIHVSLGTRLAVPDTAVMDTGERRVAFVEESPGHYAPHELQIGQEADGYFEVLKGLQENDRVVTSANFFIDSESKMKAR